MRGRKKQHKFCQRKIKTIIIINNNISYRKEGSSGRNSHSISVCIKQKHKPQTFGLETWTLDKHTRNGWFYHLTNTFFLFIFFTSSCKFIIGLCHVWICVCTRAHKCTHSQVCTHSYANSTCNKIVNVLFFSPSCIGCRHHVNRKVELTNSNSINYYGCFVFMNEIQFTMAKASLYDNLWEEIIGFHFCFGVFSLSL